MLRSNSSAPMGDGPLFVLFLGYLDADGLDSLAAGRLPARQCLDVRAEHSSPVVFAMMFQNQATSVLGAHA